MAASTKKFTTDSSGAPIVDKTLYDEVTKLLKTPENVKNADSKRISLQQSSRRNRQHHVYSDAAFKQKDQTEVPSSRRMTVQMKGALNGVEPKASAVTSRRQSAMEKAPSNQKGSGA